MNEDTHRQLLYGNAETLVLKTIEEGSLHGYAIRRKLYERSVQYFQLSFGRLYPLLAKLERQRLILGRQVRRGPVREVREYRITEKGRRELALQLLVWDRFAERMNRILHATTEKRPAV